MLLELTVSFLCGAREFLCPWCRRWCTSRGFLGWLPCGVESLRVFHVLYFVWCSSFFVAAQIWLLRGHCQGNAECWALHTDREQGLALGALWGKVWRKSGILSEFERWFGSLSGKCGAQEQKWHFRQLQKMPKLHLCAIVGVISGSICSVSLLSWNHRVRQGQVFLSSWGSGSSQKVSCPLVCD